jgi:hypothetical protein
MTGDSDSRRGKPASGIRGTSEIAMLKGVSWRGLAKAAVIERGFYLDWLLFKGAILDLR